MSTQFESFSNGKNPKIKYLYLIISPSDPGLADYFAYDKLQCGIQNSSPKFSKGLYKLDLPYNKAFHNN